MKILTDIGFKEFDGFIERGKRNDLLYIGLSNGNFLKCTPCHEILMEDGVYLPAEFIEVNSCLYGGIIVENIEYLEEAEIIYDALNVSETYSYWTEGIISHNCVFLDEFAFVHNADVFYTSTYPVITSGSDTKVIITSTPNGVGNMFYRLWQGAIQKANEFKPFTIKWWEVPGRDEAWKAQTIANTSELQFHQEFECISGDSEVDVIINSNKIKIKLRNLYEAYPILHNA